MLSRRIVLKLSSEILLAGSFASSSIAGSGANILGEIPILLEGDWGQMYGSSVMKVLRRARAACLMGVRQLSDRQPRSLKVERHTAGPPAIWLHADQADTACVIVNIGERDWSKLAYQFGHELGHVMANSWRQDSRVTSASTCQWIEEASVEALSINGLRQLSESWYRSPPFPGDAAFGVSLSSYHNNIIEQYRDFARIQGRLTDASAWFARNRPQLEGTSGLSDTAKAASLILLELYTQRPNCVEALGALNRWPERAALPATKYLDNWTRSCAQIGADAFLPEKLRSFLIA